VPTSSADREAAREAGFVPPRVRLGIEIRGLRMRLGLSQRHLVRVLGLRAHSNLVDYEKGRRIPPADIVIACERALKAPPGYLQDLRARALADRALEWRARQLSAGSERRPRALERLLELVSSVA
jgi:transcriptional regulator with XRE-family HTH domain